MTYEAKLKVTKQATKFFNLSMISDPLESSTISHPVVSIVIRPDRSNFEFLEI